MANLDYTIALWRFCSSDRFMAAKKWGIQIFVTIALAQLVAYSGLIDSPTNQIFLICFHLITLVLYFFIKNLVNS